MASEPVCSVVVPSLNHGDFLETALLSILEQPVPVEVIVMDGGSTDGTCEILRRYESRLAWWQSAPDGGQAAAINAGMNRACAPFVAWLNADDAYLPGGLADLVQALDRDPEAPCVYARALIIDRRGRALGEYRTGEFSRRRLARRCFIAQPATLIRRTAWDRVGGVDQSMHFAFDYDLWWKLSEGGGPLRFLDRPVAATRAHADTKTIRGPFAHYREAFAVLRRHHGTVPWIWYAKLLPSIGWRWAAARVGSRALS